MTPDGPRLFLPRFFATELKTYTREQASGMKALGDRHLGQYTTIDHESEYMLSAIKLDLNQNLGKFVADVEDEVAYAFETQFPPCEGWTSINLHEKLLRIVSQASARIFVGPPLNRDSKWLECTEKFATDAMIGGERLKLWRPFLRPLAQYFIPELRSVRADHAEAYRLLRPVLEARTNAAKKDGYEKPNDMLQWIQDRVATNQDVSIDFKEIAKIQVLTATAAIHTTRLAIIHAIFDLAARPEYIEPLREELKDVLEKTDGTITKQSLTQLRKLDSFMKESQRHNPPSVGKHFLLLDLDFRGLTENIATFQRKILKPVKLSNGLELPVGVIVQCNTAILDEAPKHWGDPYEFDGFRFFKLRSNPSESNQYQFASPTINSMEFGLGKDACPGRFFASNQIKIVLAHVIRNYEIRLEHPQKGRPKNLMFEVNVLADPTARIMLKRKS